MFRVYIRRSDAGIYGALPGLACSRDARIGGVILQMIVLLLAGLLFPAVGQGTSAVLSETQFCGTGHPDIISAQSHSISLLDFKDKWALWDAEGQHLNMQELIAINRDYGAGILFFRTTSKQNLNLETLKDQGYVLVMTAHPGYSPFNNSAFLADPNQVRNWAIQAAANPYVDALALDIESATATTYSYCMQIISEEARNAGKPFIAVPHFSYEKYSAYLTVEDYNQHADIVMPWLYNRYGQPTYKQGLLAMVNHWKNIGITAPVYPIFDWGRPWYGGISPAEASEVPSYLRANGVATICLFQPHISYREIGSNTDYRNLWNDLRDYYGWTPVFRIQCEDYSGGDSAQQGVDYYDTTSGNTGGQYRNDDVDIEVCAEGGYNIGWIVAGEWLRYTDVEVTPGGYQQFWVRYAAPSGPRQLRICEGSLDNTILQLNLPATGGWQTWATVTGITTVPLTDSLHTIYLVAESSGFNLNWFEYRAIYDAIPPEPFTISTNASPWTNTDVVASFSTVDNLGGSGIHRYTGQLNNGTWIDPVSSPWTISSSHLLEGLNTITVGAYDYAGNYTNSPIRGFIFDSTPPADFTPAVDPTGWTDGGISITFSTTDDRSGVARYEAKIGDGEFIVKTSPWTISAGTLIPGSHIVTIRAYDGAGNYTDATCLVNYAQGIANIADFKELADGEIRSLKGKIVTYVGDGFFYVSEPDRTSGIKVLSSQSVSVGNIVELAGAINGAGSERYIDCVNNLVFVD